MFLVTIEVEDVKRIFRTAIKDPPFVVERSGLIHFLHMRGIGVTREKRKIQLGSKSRSNSIPFLDFQDLLPQLSRQFHRFSFGDILVMCEKTRIMAVWSAPTDRDLSLKGGRDRRLNENDHKIHVPRRHRKE